MYTFLTTYAVLKKEYKRRQRDYIEQCLGRSKGCRVSDPLCWLKCCFPGISWPGSLSKSHSIRWICQSALSSLRLPIQQGTRISALCAERCGMLLRGCTGHRLHQPKPLCWCPTSLLYLGISLFCVQQRSVWKCSPDSPSACSLRASILGCSHRAILEIPLPSFGHFLH